MDDGPSARPLGIGLLLAALLGSALAAAMVYSDVLTGRAAPVTQVASDECRTLPPIAPDGSGAGLPPGNALRHLHGLLPLLPVVNYEASLVKVTGYDEYPTPAIYRKYSSLLLSSPSTATMVRHGFRSAAAIGYTAGQINFGVEAFALASAEEAAAFERETLAETCRDGSATNVHPLPGIAGGVLFTFHDANHPAYRASFLVNDSVVRLNVCVCVAYQGDPFDVVAAWAVSVNTWVRDPLP